MGDIAHYQLYPKEAALSAALTKSGPLSTSLLVVLQFSFLASPQAKNDLDSDRKCKFHRFCPARSDCNNIAHGERF